VFDKDAKRLRPLNWRDVAILSRRTTEFARLEAALRNAGVPYRIEGGKVFFQREEIAAVVQGLLALEDADDSAALGQWLGSDLVGFSDADLLQHVYARDDRRLTFFGNAAQPGGEISRLLAEMRALHEQRNRVGCLATTRALFDLVGALPTAFTFPRREVAVANLHKALETARAADRARQTFGEFAHAWATAFAEERDEADYAITEDADDVVRVLTIHKAKGLDWPAVVLIDLAAKPRGGSPPILHRRATGELAVRLADQRETLNHKVAAEIEKNFEAAERVRQLYVAMTRARDYLVLPLFGKAGKPSGYLAFLQQAGMIDEEQQTVDAMGAKVESVAVASLESPDAPRWELPREFAARALTPAVKAEVDQLLAAREATPADPPAAPALIFESPSKREGELPQAAEGGAGKRMGLAFHSVMELLPLGRPADWPKTIAAVTRQYELSPKESELLRRWLGNFAALPCFSQLAGGRVWRETPFTWTDPHGVSFSGKLDLLAETTSGLLILDYKTDRVTGDELAARVDAYRPQALIYRDAMRGLMKRDDVRLVLCFVDVGKEIKIE
jgi:ATP-dependent exoDNAse (exonuclease V) beta subunit